MSVENSIYEKFHGRHTNGNSCGEWQWGEGKLEKINYQVLDVLKIEQKRFKNYAFDLLINRRQRKTEKGMTEMFHCRRNRNTSCVKSKRKSITIEYFNCYEAFNKRIDCENENKHYQRY